MWISSQLVTCYVLVLLVIPVALVVAVCLWPSNSAWLCSEINLSRRVQICWFSRMWRTCSLNLGFYMENSFCSACLLPAPWPAIPPSQQPLWPLHPHPHPHPFSPGSPGSPRFFLPLSHVTPSTVPCRAVLCFTPRGQCSPGLRVPCPCCAPTSAPLLHQQRSTAHPVYTPVWACVTSPSPPLHHAATVLHS